MPHSNFLVTINLNRVPNPKRDKLFKRTVKQMFNSKIHKYLKILTAGDTIHQVSSIEVEIAFEVGPKYNRSHAHIIVMLIHETKVHIDTKRLTKDLLAKLNLDNIYVNASFIPPSRLQEKKEYIRKGTAIKDAKTEISESEDDSD